ncbi:MAG: carboxypeptidase-like regulatory domain-containing protein, partial [Leptospira sp.]|nr:carboxypeptidase-like regulatory domain-containing protein [Leptospira sp.]
MRNRYRIQFSGKSGLLFLQRTIFVFALLLPASEIFAVAFRGRLFNQVTDKPEAQVTVMIFETKKFYQADANGYFDGEVPSPGTYTFRVLRPSGMIEIRKPVSQEDELVTIF